ncbi:hypothetical protein [Kutzneria sp. NPDC052558]|uniref:hypothetical protein n=1 Tax=Kutzneria sp. NPDC052558 TaxID=3364121 RepID=UPI0037C67E8F
MARTAGIAAALLTATAAPLLTAAPAQAAAQDCIKYLADHYEKPSQQAVTGCAFGAVLAKATCVSYMTTNGVTAADAKQACKLAGEPSQN